MSSRARCSVLLLAALTAAACDRHPPQQAAPQNPVASASTSASASASAAVADAAPAPPPPKDPTPDVLEAAKAGCTLNDGVSIHAAPQAPSIEGPVKLFATSSKEPADGIIVIPPGGTGERLTSEPRPGPPANVYAEIPTPLEGKYKVLVHAGPKLVGCAEIAVAKKASHASRVAPSTVAWVAKRDWTAADEDLYAAWIEKMFDAPVEEQPSYDSLDPITSDAKKNFLHDYLGIDEDAPPPKGLKLDPDCADLPYYLRAYFAWKMALPFAYSQCSRGGGGLAPKCLHDFSIADGMDDPPKNTMRRFETFVRKTVADTVHSGSGRTKGDDDDTDYYPITLTHDALRPGVVYADPYGHVLVVAKIVPQTKDSSGALFAVDGQPDGTVGRKRFWEGNFLFMTDDPAMGGPGFKRFRRLDLKGGAIRRIDNKDLGKNPANADYGMDQYAGTPSDFYDHVDDVLNPEPRDPERALLDTIQALEEQVKTRVIGVANGENRFKKSSGMIPMPDGTAIFETVGDWEDFSTPGRDMRLLIAIDVATGFPAKFARRSNRFHMPPNKTVDQVEQDLKEILTRELAARKVTYTRMDGSSFTLSLQDVVDRQAALEMAYNPNDCVESRWGAPEGSAEMSTCKRRAPADQRKKMESIRSWWNKRRRPPRK
ncbi:MAG: hypothetical protein U0414_14995 [Polyangiaceae bacterium]